jgi:membrane fusion protein, multidrug efflux system
MGLERIVLAAVLTLLAGCNSGAGDASTNGRANAPAVPVHVANAEKRDIPIQVRAIGTVEPFTTVAVKSQVEGSLAGVHFSEGDAVQKGQLLFTIDPRPFEAALRQAEANLARELAEARNATVDAERRTTLFAQGLVSRDEYDKSQTTAASLQAAAKADEAAVENARLSLQYCFIRSPVDARAGQVLVHQGNLVKENDTTLAVLNQVHPAYVAFSVPEQWLPEIRQRASEGLAVDAYVGKETKPVRGDLRFINNTVDTTTGTVLLKGLFANADEALWPGQFVDVSLTLRVQLGAVLVPLNAILPGQQGQYVYVVGADGAAEVRPVSSGEVVGSDVVVTQGLEPGETVVTDGQLRLAPGTKVEVLREEARDRG